ncbi:unnamed protein product [Cladocopium goreaui]|uniref:Uncharacterized protein n=1 Tax=Cladocopium goreaui TaxID=2562237 RepID=A0A9P1GN83_9DINO|nr:unnamed protein product [Cladocopium goreaui]
MGDFGCAVPHTHPQGLDVLRSEDYLKPFCRFADAEVQVDGGDEGRLRQDLEAALELNQQLEEVLREKSRASQEAEAKAAAALELNQQLEEVLRQKSRASQEAEDLRRVAEISEAEREKHQKLEQDLREASETREAEQKHQHQLEKALQDAEIQAQKEHRSWHRERQRCEKLQEELKISTSEAAEATAKVKKLESTMATSEANRNDLRETVEILKSECTQELASRRTTAKDLQLSQEKLQALSVLTDQLRSEVQEARRSLKGSTAPTAAASAEPVTVCYEPIAVTEQALRIQATELKRSLSQPHLPRRMNGIAPQRPQLHQADQSGSRSHPQSEMPKISTSAGRNGQVKWNPGNSQSESGRSQFPSIPLSFETLRAEIAAAAAHRRRVWGGTGARAPRQLSVTVESSSEEDIVASSPRNRLVGFIVGSTYFSLLFSFSGWLHYSKVNGWLPGDDNDNGF